MATVKGKNEGKSGFLKEFFVDHPDAGKNAINEAWREAGHEGSISPSLIQKIRSNLGLKAKGRSRAGVTTGAGAETRPSIAPKSSARGTGPERGGRTAVKANGRHVTEAPERPAEPETAGDDRTRMLIRLEGQIDDMIHEIKLAGGLPEFEVALRKARRILARSHGE